MKDFFKMLLFGTNKIQNRAPLICWESSEIFILIFSQIDNKNKSLNFDQKFRKDSEKLIAFLILGKTENCHEYKMAYSLIY